ncbi:hypothetical protein JTB14_032918 [Gonioctena quinquepunctata]|nr:hypothetical protein JTB14_032918 [Gonioctena quinquepunctata]
MNYALKNAVPMGQRQHLEANLRHVRSSRAQLKTAKKHGGAGSEVTKETAKHRVHWDDSTSAFNSRIRTGVITNLKHKDTNAFLIDCKSLFKCRVQNALRLNESVKVNTAFGGEFELTKGDKIQSEFKNGRMDTQSHYVGEKTRKTNSRVVRKSDGQIANKEEENVVYIEGDAIKPPLANLTERKITESPIQTPDETMVIMNMMSKELGTLVENNQNTKGAIKRASKP